MACDFMENVDLALDLLRLGARPVTVSNITGVPRNHCIELYKRIHRRNPPKGMLPYAAEWFVSCESVRIQSSDLIGFYRKRYHSDWRGHRYSESGIEGGTSRHQVVSFIYAYQQYLALYNQDARLKVDRAWTLCRFYEIGSIEYLLCKKCLCAFVRVADEAQYHCFACGGSEYEMVPL